MLYRTITVHYNTWCYTTVHYVTLQCIALYHITLDHITLFYTTHDTRQGLGLELGWSTGSTWPNMSIFVTMCVCVCVLSKKCDAPQYCPVKIKLGRVVNYRICTYIYIYNYIYIIIYLFWFLNRGNLPKKTTKTSKNRTSFDQLSQTLNHPVFVSKQPLPGLVNQQKTMENHHV